MHTVVGDESGKRSAGGSQRAARGLRARPLGIDERIVVAQIWQQSSARLHAVFVRQPEVSKRGTKLRIVLPRPMQRILQRNGQGSRALLRNSGLGHLRLRWCLCKTRGRGGKQDQNGNQLRSDLSESGPNNSHCIEVRKTNAHSPPRSAPVVFIDREQPEGRTLAHDSHALLAGNAVFVLKSSGVQERRERCWKPIMACAAGPIWNWASLPQGF